MDEFGIPWKLIELTKICIENTQYQVKVENSMSEAFEVKIGLNQRV